jgi:hypothetical protein
MKLRRERGVGSSVWLAVPNTSVPRVEKLRTVTPWDVSDSPGENEFLPRIRTYPTDGTKSIGALLETVDETITANDELRHAELVACECNCDRIEALAQAFCWAWVACRSRNMK